MVKKKKTNAITKKKKPTVKKVRKNIIAKVASTKRKGKEKTKKPTKLVKKSLEKNTNRKTNTKTKSRTILSGTKGKSSKPKKQGKSVKKKSLVRVKTVTRKKNAKGKDFKRDSKTVIFEFQGKSYSDKTNELFAVLKDKIKYALYSNRPFEPVGLFILVVAKNAQGENFQVYKTSPEFVVNMKNTVGYIKQVWNELDVNETFSKSDKSDEPIEMKFSKNIIRLEIVFIY